MGSSTAGCCRLVEGVPTTCNYCISPHLPLFNYVHVIDFLLQCVSRDSPNQLAESCAAVVSCAVQFPQKQTAKLFCCNCYTESKLDDRLTISLHSRRVDSTTLCLKGNPLLSIMLHITHGQFHNGRGYL